MLDIRRIQEKIREKYYEKDSERGIYATFTWLVEEVGELAEALLKGDEEEVREEIADIIAWTVSLANIMGVDLEEALAHKYSFLRK